MTRTMATAEPSDMSRSPFVAAVAKASGPPAVGLEKLLEHLCRSQGSDLHLKAGARPHVRIGGHLEPTDFPRLELQRAGLVAAKSATMSS